MNDVNRSFGTSRRHLLGAAAATAGAVRMGLFGTAEGTTFANPPEAAPSLRPDSFGPIRRVFAGDLVVAFVETGPLSGSPVILLHGWPYDVHAFADVAPLLAGAGYRVIVPHLRGFGATRFRSPSMPRNGQQSVLASDVVALMDALGLRSALLAGFDWGARTACIVAALWPERCKALVSVSGYLIGSQRAGSMPLTPKAELAWWYQFYFATERGRAGYDANRRDFARLIWRTASPAWDFDEATFERSAASLDNPDHVAIVIHNYRWRLGVAKGDPRFDDMEVRLAASPPITVPSISMEGDGNGAPHPEPDSYRTKFTARYEHRQIGGRVGHNLPQEAPQAFVDAVLSVDRF